MQDIDLNIGGCIGAITGGGLAVAFICFTMDTTHPTKIMGSLFLGGVIGGAFAGNVAWASAWACLFNNPDDPPEDSDSENAAYSDEDKTNQTEDW
jgi:phosphate/sulfate permease